MLSGDTHTPGLKLKYVLTKLSFFNGNILDVLACRRKSSISESDADKCSSSSQAEMVQTTHFSFISTNQHFRDVKQFYVGRAILGLEANCLQALQFLSNWNKDLFIEIYKFLVALHNCMVCHIGCGCFTRI